ncbi:MAG TPA: DUF2127 domain-containing protein [Gaiellaceae bacterium]|nr:DUF2127 domain-containing protein [Gaiellaceae bacterium]
MHRPPGTRKPRRFRPRFHWELLACGVAGHELLGTDVKTLRPQDAFVAREDHGIRWYRCVRCDSWLPLPPPMLPARETLPPRDEIELPLRGRPLRDKVVLRVIAIDRAIHFVVLAVLSAAVFLFASHQLRLRDFVFRVVNAAEGTNTTPQHRAHSGFAGTIEHLFTLRSSTLYAVAVIAAVYALVEGLEAVGLWYQQRWAEYLTFVATLGFIPYEIYELTRGPSPLKYAAFGVNVAIALYLLYGKRLFGVRGGIAGELEARAREVGWEALERTAPSAAQRGEAPA